MLRKALAIGGLSAASFSNGFVYGQMGGMIGALQRKEGGIELSEGQRSSIVSILTMMTLVGMGLAAYVTDKLGRRWPVIIFSLPSAIQWIILYHSYSMYHFMISRIVAGISVGGLITLTLFVTSEYTSPKTRAFYLNMVTTVASALGASLGHALGIVLHWRTVALIGIIPAVVSSVVPIFWVESPHWLASKERFEECEIAFRKLHGNNPSSERELSLIIKTERSKLKQAKESNCKPTSKRLLAAFKRKYFWKLFLTTIFMDAYFAASGKLIFTSLATVILEEITGTADVLLYTLLIDCFVIIGSCLSCFLIRRTSLRTLLFSTGFAANAILVVFSGCYYFKNGQSYFNWINVSLLALYFVAVNAGPYPLLEVLFTEIFPLEIKAYAFAMSATILVPSVTSTVVLLPVTVSWIGYHGVFLLNAAIMSVSLGYIWLRLPETKGRTLQELEVFFKTNNFDVDEILCNNEQSKSLI